MHSPRVNFLIRSLSNVEYERFATNLELVGLNAGAEIFHSGQQSTEIYFPTTCTVSAQIELEQGATTDIFLLGDRGLFGTGTIKRGMYYKAIVRKPGFAYRCPIDAFMKELLRGEGIMLMSLMATRIMMEEMSKNFACRSFHTVTQQVSRWLINYGQGDQVENVKVTHSEFADALGVRREAITLALNQIEQKGSISLSRGRINIKNYTLLSELACNCNSESTLNKDWSEAELEAMRNMPSKLKTNAEYR